MKKVYIAVVVIFMMALIALVVLNNSKRKAETEALKIKLESTFNDKGNLKFDPPRLQKQVDKEKLRKMLLFRQKKIKDEEKKSEDNANYKNK